MSEPFPHRRSTESTEPARMAHTPSWWYSKQVCGHCESPSTTGPMSRSAVEHIGSANGWLANYPGEGSVIKFRKGKLGE